MPTLDFFHLTTIMYRKNNSIDYLCRNDRTWLEDSHDIGQESKDFYSNLFTSANPIFPEDMVRLYT